jgi:hypothetical protein
MDEVIRMIETTIIIATITIISLVMFESFLESTWTRFLFISGISIYSKEYKFTRIPSVRELSEQNRSKLIQPIIFHEFSKNEIGFRESMLPKSFLAYTPIMRGYIFIKYDDNVFKIKGFVNYRSLVLILLFVIFTVLGLYHGSFITIIFIPFSLLVIGILYVIQLNRFDKIGEFISNF